MIVNSNHFFVLQGQAVATWAHTGAKALGLAAGRIREAGGSGRGNLGAFGRPVPRPGRRPQAGDAKTRPALPRAAAGRGFLQRSTANPFTNRGEFDNIGVVPYEKRGIGMRTPLRGDKTFFRGVAAIGLPVALQNLLTTSASMVDTMMIGSQGETAVAAVGLCAQFSLLMMTA